MNKYVNVMKLKIWLLATKSKKQIEIKATGKNINT